MEHDSVLAKLNLQKSQEVFDFHYRVKTLKLRGIGDYLSKGTETRVESTSVCHAQG